MVEDFPVPVFPNIILKKNALKHFGMNSFFFLGGGGGGGGMAGKIMFGNFG
jgi:hypothetical protein